MKISNTLQNNTININFRAGNTKLYTDFDGTYFPFSQDALMRKDEKSILKTNSMFSDFKKFIDKAKEKFSLFITTGRSKAEMFGVINIFKQMNVIFNVPVGYVLRDGLEEISSMGIENLDSVSNSQFLKNTNSIIKIIRGIDDKLTIIEPVSNKWIKGRENDVLQSKFEKLSPEKQQRYVSIVSEDNGMLEIAFTPNIDTKSYVSKITEYYKKNNIPVNIQSYNSDNNVYVPVKEDISSLRYIFKPSNTIFIKPIKDGVIPDKLIQTKNEVKNIIQNKSNDLVVAAGDGLNDINMLNPLNYIDILGISINKKKTIEELLEQEEVLSAISELPLVVIVTGEHECMEPILKIKEILDQKGIQKIFTAKNPSSEFLDKIKLGMLIYSENNDEYKYNLGYDLYEELLGL